MIISTFKSTCCKADVSAKKEAMICDKCKKDCGAKLTSEKAYELADYFNKKEVRDDKRRV